MNARDQDPPNRVAVVIPCYRVAEQIETVIRRLPSLVSWIVVVDDASPDRTIERVTALADPRVQLLRHDRNQGVGGAMRTGYQKALALGADIIVKMDGDDQMDPAYLPALVRPLVEHQADFTKGNRWHDPACLVTMPLVRRLGNLALSFLTKLASGYWSNFDPCNGYTAIHAAVLQRVRLDHLANDYFFETSMLLQLNGLRAVVRDVPIPARYGDAGSSLRIPRILLRFPPALVKASLQRIWQRYFVMSFEPAAAFLTGGFLLCLWGVGYGGYSWIHSIATGQPATAGTVMLSAMPFLMGFQMLLQAAVIDIADQPREPLCKQPRGQSDHGTASAC